jgi:hypothetical protein
MVLCRQGDALNKPREAAGSIMEGGIFAVSAAKRFLGGKIGRLLACMGLLCLFSGLSLPGSIMGEEIMEIGKWVNPDHYPDRFENLGRIDRIGGGEIVINDTLFRLSTYVKYHTPEQLDTPGYEFREGRYVGYFVNDQREITSLWLIK